MRSKNYLPQVRDQYEQYPFPVRDPADERSRLIASELDRLTRIDHHCFGGRRDYGLPMRVLVAGGGTGDALIYLAEQLRGCPAEFVFVDMSAASLDVARARAEVRGLDGVTWVHGSILDLSEREHGLFDYINCVGVLHHLDDPGAGLAALRSCLAEGGGMGLMLYGKYGRRQVYRVQELLSLVCQDGSSLPERVEQARRALLDLAAGGRIQLSAEVQRLLEDPRNDAYLVDTYLHEVDRAYSAGDIHDLLATCGLQLAGFTNFFEEQGRVCALDYDPSVFFGDPQLRETVSAMPASRQGHIADLVGASVSMHAFYASDRADRPAPADQLDLAPAFATSYGQRMAASVLTNRPESLAVHLNCGVTSQLPVTEVTRALLARVGGRQTLREIGNRLAPEGGEAARPALLSHVDLLVRLGLVTLRDPALPRLPVLPSTRPWTGAIDLRPFTADGPGS